MRVRGQAIFLAVAVTCGWVAMSTRARADAGAAGAPPAERSAVYGELMQRVGLKLDAPPGWDWMNEAAAAGARGFGFRASGAALDVPTTLIVRAGPVSDFRLPADAPPDKQLVALAESLRAGMLALKTTDMEPPQPVTLGGVPAIQFAATTPLFLTGDGVERQVRSLTTLAVVDGRFYNVAFTASPANYRQHLADVRTMLASARFANAPQKAPAIAEPVEVAIKPPEATTTASPAPAPEVVAAAEPPAPPAPPAPAPGAEPATKPAPANEPTVALAPLPPSTEPPEPLIEPVATQPTIADEPAVAVTPSAPPVEPTTQRVLKPEYSVAFDSVPAVPTLPPPPADTTPKRPQYSVAVMPEPPPAALAPAPAVTPPAATQPSLESVVAAAPAAPYAAAAAPTPPTADVGSVTPPSTPPPSVTTVREPKPAPVVLTRRTTVREFSTVTSPRMDQQPDWSLPSAAPPASTIVPVPARTAAAAPAPAPADQPMQVAAAPTPAAAVPPAAAKPGELPATRPAPAQIAAEPAAPIPPAAPLAAPASSGPQQTAVAPQPPLPAARPVAPPAPMTKPPVSREVLLAMKPASDRAPVPAPAAASQVEEPTPPAPSASATKPAPAPAPVSAVATTPPPAPATAPVVASASEPPVDAAPTPAVALKTYTDNAGTFAVSVPESWRPGKAPPTRVAIVLTGPSAVPDRKAPPIFRAQVGQQSPGHAKRSVDEFARDLIQQVTKRSPDSGRTRVEPARIDGVEARQFMLTLEDSRGMDIDMKYVVAIKPPIGFIFTYLQERGLFDEAEADAIFSSIRWTSSDGRGGRAKPSERSDRSERPVERSSAR